MKVVKKILFIIISILLSIVLLVNIYNFVSLKILKKDLSSVFGYAVLEVISGSMEPTINVGDMIIINTHETNYEKGDIVTFYDTEGSFVTHRIVSINDTYMITKGDNKNNALDGETSIDKIVGKHVLTIPGFGRIIKSLQSPITIVLILIVGVIACIFLSIDNNGEVILSEEEKEYLEFKNKQKELKKGNKKKVK